MACSRPEVSLLACLARQRDSCGELRLRTVLRILLWAAKQANNPAVLDALTLPCLNILQEAVLGTGN